MDTLSKVYEYLNNLEAFLDDGDSLEAKMIMVEKSERELEIKPFMRFSTPYGVDGQGAWDAELDMADSHNYMTKEMFDKLGFVRVDYGDYGRKMVKEVRVEIHGFTFLVDFFVIGVRRPSSKRITGIQGRVVKGSQEDTIFNTTQFKPKEQKRFGERRGMSEWGATHAKSYEQHVMKTLSKMNQTSGNANPFAYMAQATHLTSLPSHYVSPPPQYAPALTNKNSFSYQQPISEPSTIQRTKLRFKRVRLQQRVFNEEAYRMGNKENCCHWIYKERWGAIVRHLLRYCHGRLGHVEWGFERRSIRATWNHCALQRHKGMLMEAKEKGAILDAEALM
ncbi:hypothetical protein Tco_0524337 [Tanacetum coccineum]